MPGVRITRNVNPEIKKKLGFGVVAKLSFLLGVPYPLPDWYFGMSVLQKTLWMVYCRFGDLMTALLLFSNLIELFVAYTDIRAFVTCTGSIAYIFCFRIKMYLYKTKTKTLERVIDSLHEITENLVRNPFKDDGFFDIYQNYFKHAIFFGKGKIGATAGGVCTLAIFEMIHGYFQDSNSKRNLPMFGWYPYDPYELSYFELSCMFQLLSYLAFLLKDVVVDLLFLTILLILNSHLIYLRVLLGRINEHKKTPAGLVQSEDKMDTLTWWIKHHQMVLKAIEDFKEITNPYLFYKYISVGVILFFGGVLVTSDIEYDLIQQMIVLAINSSNLLQLYIFSVVGDKITENGLRLTEQGLHVDMVSNNRKVRTSYLYIATKCSKPILIHFGQITPLCVASFGRVTDSQIVKVTFSYFITIVQIRDKALEIEEPGMGFLNSTEI